MAGKISVTGGQAKAFLRRSRELENQFEKRPEEILEGMQLLIGGGGWLGEILTRERQCDETFFDMGFDLEEFRKTLQKYGQKKIQEWQKLGLEPHFLPAISMNQDTKFRRWRVKPDEWYFWETAEGKILRQQPDGKLIVDKKAFKLEGITVLIDTRLKPAYSNGKQMYKNDNLLGSIIEKLRKDEKIAGYDCGSQSSRFGISTDEWEREVKPALSELLGLDVSQVRLEKAIEANVIPQLYPYMLRKDDGKTNSWVWYEEFFGDRDRRLGGGDSDDGGLANVDRRFSDDHWISDSVRPLIVL